jgi:hypothetical protein
MFEPNISESLFADHVLTEVEICYFQQLLLRLSWTRFVSRLNTPSSTYTSANKNFISQSFLISSWLAGTIRRSFCRGRPRTTTRKLFCVGLVLGRDDGMLYKQGETEGDVIVLVEWRREDIYMYIRGMMLGMQRRCVLGCVLVLQCAWLEALGCSEATSFVCPSRRPWPGARGPAYT